MALSIAIWHFDLQITLRIPPYIKNTNHFVKPDFSEVITAWIIIFLQSLILQLISPDRAS